MSRKKVELELSARPDGYGFFYGQARLGDVFCQVNVLPPARLWDGDVMLDDYRPDETHWIIYANGEEIARVERREDLAGAMPRRLIQS